MYDTYTLTGTVRSKLQHGWLFELDEEGLHLVDELESNDSYLLSFQYASKPKSLAVKTDLFVLILADKEIENLEAKSRDWDDKKEIVALLRQRSRPYLFSNTVAPPVVAGSLKALELVRRLRVYSLLSKKLL